MEGQQVSKKAAPAYDDVFGGPPRFSGSLPARLHDYADIFSGAACRIPFLDLPAATDGLDGGVAAGSWRGPRFDYAEVFGNLDFGELAVSYEELFARPKWAEAGPSDGRAIEAPTISHQATKESEFSLEDTKEGHMARAEDNRDCFSSKSNHSDHDSKKSDLSYNRPSPNSKEGAISGTTHLTDPSGFGLIVDAITPVQSQKGDAPCSMVNGVRNDEKLQSKFLSNSSSNGLKVSGNEFTTDQKKSTSQSPVSDIDRANLNHHLHSSSSNSITGEDALSSNVMYASVSDISLRTQPLQVPPPSRPPPTIFDKKGHPMLKTGTNSKINLDGRSSSKPNENPEEHSSVVFSKSHACEDAVKDSPFFFDVDIDANSSAAASAAAMKEAMELARARLKSAKDSMEKKRVNFHNHKKLGHHENKKERKVDQSSTEEDNIIEMSTQKTLVKEDKQVDAIASKERNKITNVGKASPNVGETERQVVMAKHHQQMVPRNNLKSENEFGECRVNHEHYELVSNENKYIIVGDLCDQEGTRKKTIETANISNDNHDENKEATLASEFESNRSLKEDNEKSDEGENATNLKVDIVACKKKVIKEITNVVVLACLHQEDVDDLQKVRVSSGEANENLEEAQHVHDGDMSLPYTIGNNTISRRSEETLELSGCQEFRGIHDSKADRKSKASEESCECDDNLYKSELIHRSTEEKLNSETAKEAFESEDNEKDLTVADVSCEQCKSENNLNVSMIFAILNEKEMKMPVGSCVCEAEEELNAASECRDSKKPMGVEQVDCDHTENLDQMDESKVAVAQEVREELCLTQESHTLGKNESGLDVNQVADELGEDLKKLKESGAMMYGKPEKLMKSTEAACLRYCNEMKAKTVQVEEQKSDKIQEAAQVPCLLANSGKQNICQRDHEVIENGEIREIHVKPEFSDNSNILNTVPDASGGPLFTDLDVQQEALSEKIIGTLESAQDATKNYNVGSEKTTGDFKKTEEEENERMERGKKWAEVQARKLEEEKEREREREKDRLAVERATGEAHERALAEAREREKRISVERVTAEARQRALKESRERAEKASVLAMEKSLAEKALREARLRAERAAVERATAEARERAAERALAEKAAADARELTERPNGTYRDRLSRENVTEEHFRARNKDGPSGAKFRSNGSSSNCKGYSALNNQSEGESALRCKARLERHQRTAERVAKALAEKNMRDILSQREQAERHRLAEYLDADVKRWSNGKEGNLRALLSTLQYVLGPKSGWQSISLTDVITAAAVKKAYRKATLCVHPDKLQQRGASIQQKYICEKVFDLLKEAWNKFNSEER